MFTKVWDVHGTQTSRQLNTAILAGPLPLENRPIHPLEFLIQQLAGGWWVTLFSPPVCQKVRESMNRGPSPFPGVFQLLVVVKGQITYRLSFGSSVCYSNSSLEECLGRLIRLAVL